MQPQILVVDDQLTVVKSWEAVLSETGIGVVGTRDGHEAWDKFQRTKFDAVITDIKMPGMDGIELLKKIKDTDKEVEVIVFTGYGSQDNVGKARDLGAYEFILKPVSPHTMTDVAIRALARRGFTRDQFTPRWQWLVRPPDIAARMKAELEAETAGPEAGLITKEHLEKLETIVVKYRGRPGSLIPTLQEAQNLIGFLPPDIQRKVAGGLDIPASEVFSVVTFYAFFTMSPKGRHNIRVCLGTACYVKGGKEIVGKIKDNIGIGIGDITPDMKFSLEAVRCLGACGLAPTMTVGQDVHGRINISKVMDILDQYE